MQVTGDGLTDRQTQMFGNYLDEHPFLWFFSDVRFLETL
jgi:hypothetical protein